LSSKKLYKTPVILAPENFSWETRLVGGHYRKIPKNPSRLI